MEPLELYSWSDADLITLAKNFDAVKALTEDEQTDLIWVLANRLEEQLG